MALYTWLGAVILFLIIICMLYLAYATPIKSKAEYKAEFYKENTIVSKEERQLFDDMHNFFLKNPKTKEIFIKSRKKK